MVKSHDTIARRMAAQLDIPYRTPRSFLRPCHGATPLRVSFKRAVFISLVALAGAAPAVGQSLPAFAPNADLLLPQPSDSTTSDPSGLSSSGDDVAPAGSDAPDALVQEPVAQPAPVACPGNPDAIGVSRIIEIDARTGPLFGVITQQTKEPSFLRPKEVVLTFDDGPVPWITGPILETLAAHCTRATFFSVGRMAVAYPKTLQAVVDAGHTVGGHTWSHPLNMRRLSSEKAIAQIEHGFSGIAEAIKDDVAPFFRFPGLSDSPHMLAYLQSRGIASFTVDVVSEDSFIRDSDDLAELTLKRIRRMNGGIVLFHDIKTATAKALPEILNTLSAEGYKVVHLRPRRMLKPSADHPAPKLVAGAGDQLSQLGGDGVLAQTLDADGNPVRRLVPFFRVTALERALDPAVNGRPVSVLEVPARERVPGLGITVPSGPMPVPPLPERRVDHVDAVGRSDLIPSAPQVLPANGQS
ncbi:MAG: polysaccharide deacetylase family protein [Pseudomonadota bacterium]